MSLEERITNILNEKNAEIAKIVASEIESFKASLVKEVPKDASKGADAETKKTKKSVTIETPKVEEPKKEEPKKSKKVETPKVEEPKIETKKTKKEEPKKEEPKVETKKSKKEEPKVETKTKKVDLSTQKCQHTIKSKPTPRLCDKACTNGGEINGVFYCSTHFKAASEKVKTQSDSKPEVKPPTTTTPAPKCQKIEELKLTKSKKDGSLFFTLDNGDKIIFRLDKKTPVGIGMIVAGTTAIVNMNSTIKHTLEMSNISFDKTKVAASSEESVEVEDAESESAEAEEASEEDKEIQINDGDDAEDEDDDEDGENDVEDDDEDEIEEEEASEEEEEDDE